MSKLIRVIEALTNITGHFSAWLVIIMMALVLFEVFMRYALNKPPAIADELSAYMLVVLAFGGTAYCFMVKGHMRVAALTENLPAKVSNWLRVATLAAVFIYALVLSKASFGYLGYSFKVGMKSTSWLRVPLQIPQMALPIGFILLALMLLITLIKTVMDIRAGKDIEVKVR